MILFGEPVSAPKTYFRGTHRSVSPAETLCRFGTRLSEFGITRLADITGLDSIGLPVYVAIRPNSRNLSTSQGKGSDHDSAKASAMMESIRIVARRAAGASARPRQLPLAPAHA